MFHLEIGAYQTGVALQEEPLVHPVSDDEEPMAHDAADRRVPDVIAVTRPGQSGCEWHR